MFKGRVFQVSMVCCLIAAAAAVQAGQEVITEVFLAKEVV